MKSKSPFSFASPGLFVTGSCAIVLAASLVGASASARGARQAASEKRQSEAQSKKAKAPEKPAAVEVQPKLRIAGEVVDEAGRPVAGALVEFLIGKDVPSVRSAADGRFVLDVSKERTYSPMLRATIENGARQAVGQWDHIDKIPDKIRLVLRKAREVPVTVVDGQERPVEGAIVAAMAFWFRVADETKSDAAGKALLRIPADAALQYVFAVKDDVGLDYFAYQREGQPASNGFALAPDHRDPIALALNGARKVTVHVVDDRGDPLANSSVYAWYFQKPKKGEILNTGFHAFTLNTDERGKALFRNIPIDNDGPIVFFSQNEDYSHQRANYEPGSPSDEIELNVAPRVTVRGRVTFASNGRPAAGAEVLAVGDGYTMDGFRSSTRSGADGRFEIRVDALQYYMFAASLDRQVSPTALCVVKPREPVGEIELVLQDGIRVFGEVTAGKKPRPLAGQYLTLYLQPEIEHHELPADGQIPNPREERKAVTPRITRSVQTDENGKFEFFTVPGKHYLFVGGGGAPRNFELSGEEDYELELHSDQPPRVGFAARVVLKSDPKKGVKGATVFGVGTGMYSGFLKAATDADGKFNTQRFPSEMVLIARSEDGKLAGIVRIQEEDESCEIAIGPTTSARGRLVNSKTGEVLAGRQLDYCARITEGGSYSNFGGSATTDEEGNFVITGLVPGWPYNLQMVVEKDASGRPHTWTPVESFEVEGEETADLGDVRVRR